MSKILVHSQRTWIFLLSIEIARAFYLPGVAPRKYVHGEQLMVKVNTLTSDLTPLQVCLNYIFAAPTATKCLAIIPL